MQTKKNLSRKYIIYSLSIMDMYVGWSSLQKPQLEDVRGQL